jgi:hypothetical protein
MVLFGQLNGWGYVKIAVPDFQREILPPDDFN